MVRTAYFHFLPHPRASISEAVPRLDQSGLPDAIGAAAERRQLDRAWVPRLSDPDDEPLLQMAVEAEVPVSVTRNVRHLKLAETFGIEVMTPGEFLAKLRKSR